MTFQVTVIMNSMKNVTKHIKMKFHISQMEILSLPSNPIEACVPKNKLSTVHYFQEKKMTSFRSMGFEKVRLFACSRMR